eukprot:304819-Alexandrium_andersonii.AAC.1
MAASGRPATSSARQASGPGALPRHWPRAHRKSKVSGWRHQPESEGIRVPLSARPCAASRSAAMPLISGPNAACVESIEILSQQAEKWRS